MKIIKNLDELDLFEDSLPTVSSGNDISKTTMLAELMFWIDENKKNIPIQELINRNAITNHQSSNNQIFKLLARASKNHAIPLFKAGKAINNDKRETLIFVWQGLINKKLKDLHHIPKYRNAIDNDYISDFLKLSSNISNLTKVGSILIERGIALIIEPSLPGLGVDGLVYKHISGNPVIALSLRHDRLDNFWFTLAHELAHISLHYDLLDNPIIEDLESMDRDEIEDEANYLASECIIRSAVWRRCEFRRKQTESALNELAMSLNIHPCLLAGKLRNETNNYEIFSKLINQHSVRDILIR
jgi:HTH-type transcriptional regulator / antitoxin HigA